MVTPASSENHENGGVFEFSENEIEKFLVQNEEE